MTSAADRAMFQIRISSKNPAHAGGRGRANSRGHRGRVARTDPQQKNSDTTKKNEHEGRRRAGAGNVGLGWVAGGAARSDGGSSWRVMQRQGGSAARGG